jgi:hypothetical protein
VDKGSAQVSIRRRHRLGGDRDEIGEVRSDGVDTAVPDRRTTLPVDGRDAADERRLPLEEPQIQECPRQARPRFPSLEVPRQPIERSRSSTSPGSGAVGVSGSREQRRQLSMACPPVRRTQLVGRSDVPEHPVVEVDQHVTVDFSLGQVGLQIRAELGPQHHREPGQVRPPAVVRAGTHLIPDLRIVRQRLDHLGLGQPEPTGRDQPQQMADQGRSTSLVPGQAGEEPPQQVGQLGRQLSRLGIRAPALGLFEGQPQPQRSSVPREAVEDQAFLRPGQGAPGSGQPAPEQAPSVCGGQSAQRQHRAVRPASQRLLGGSRQRGQDHPDVRRQRCGQPSEVVCAVVGGQLVDSVEDHHDGTIDPSLRQQLGELSHQLRHLERGLDVDAEPGAQLVDDPAQQPVEARGVGRRAQHPHDHQRGAGAADPGDREVGGDRAEQRRFAGPRVSDHGEQPRARLPPEPGHLLGHIVPTDQARPRRHRGVRRRGRDREELLGQPPVGSGRLARAVARAFALELGLDHCSEARVHRRSQFLQVVSRSGRILGRRRVGQHPI